MYLDSEGFVTIGVGFLVKNRNAAASLSLCTIKNGVPSAFASIKEKQDEYDLIKKLGTGHLARWFKKYTKLVMKKEDIDALLNQKIESFYQELTNLYKISNGYPKDFDNMPINVQLALFDMIFNLGAHQIVKEFPKFDNAIKTGNWLTASTEANRTKINQERNDYVKNLLLSAK